MPNSETPPKATPGERPCKNAKGTHHGRTYHICVYFYNCLLIPNDLLDNLLHLMILVFATPRWINDLSSHAVLNNLSSHHTLFGLRPNYGWGNGDLLQKDLCQHAVAPRLLQSLSLTLQKATVDPHLCQQLLDSHRIKYMEI
ncbi:uncharacterized protein LOC129633627 isoform X3 [Bubalus kerabau]|uniref:uncharacterized protein LOC129633627 isoform X3 n=1 Tax=Bubalus carabanensis TaxID=3119969 RepID=UPI00244E719A|nr:uncharacterized protein LOC129633627 isoform X3 [Bubalus carabanensis]XP_055411412.1 uncharacterized protein LOC129633627 isoform X3 [Bubalus carabanensis]XP_055411413.1 uncharacterized protein LOC129633627 isoform X3 [Bubalus carabanensis]XP_055411414.1 uncharacterized protein LOC129633627 isoform X3 [Bubalus carabanensis]XP_055411415.1 uncharacterized protein LOC129633627 isoform X3 [Bubalus carabanensis]XP_055411416.1 uncharacterized protein LOC129633627 isoform X3 [Bubalus carabanensis]